MQCGQDTRGPFHTKFPVTEETGSQCDANTGGPFCSDIVMVCVNLQLTFLYGLSDLIGVLGEVQVCHVGLQVADRTLPSCHAESLYGQICQEENIMVKLTAYPTFLCIQKLDQGALPKVAQPPLIHLSTVP